MRVSRVQRRPLANSLFLVLVLGVLALAWPGQGNAKTAGPRHAPPVCQSAFPSAKTTRLGRTVFYNRQSSVQSVDCYEFGLNPSADFPMTAGVACGVLSSVLGGFTRTKNLGLFTDGSCSGAALAADPKSPEGYVSTVCSWASDLLGDVTAKVGGVLGGLGCALAPPVGRSLGSFFESKHEFGVAQDVVKHGKCLKYSPSHFGSPWLAVACARSDKGFSILPGVGHAWHGCPNHGEQGLIPAPGTVDPIDPGLIADVGVAGMACTAADQAIRHGGFSGPGGTFTTGGFSCTTRTVGVAQSIRCARDNEAFRFVQGP